MEEEGKSPIMWAPENRSTIKLIDQEAEEGAGAKEMNSRISINEYNVEGFFKKNEGSLCGSFRDCLDPDPIRFPVFEYRKGCPNIVGKMYNTSNKLKMAVMKQSTIFQNLLAKNNIAPAIHDVIICKDSKKSSSPDRPWSEESVGMMIMDKISGVTIDELSKEIKLESEKRKLWDKLKAGIMFCYFQLQRLKIIPRDLHNQNMMVSDGRVYVIDMDAYEFKQDEIKKPDWHGGVGGYKLMKNSILSLKGKEKEIDDDDDNYTDLYRQWIEGEEHTLEALKKLM